MSFDAGIIVGLAFVFAFIGAVVWAEIHSRRNHRRSGNGDAAAQEDGTKPPRPK